MELEQRNWNGILHNYVDVHAYYLIIIPHTSNYKNIICRVYSEAGEHGDFPSTALKN